MTKNLKRIVLVLCVLALSASLLGTTAFAASDSLVASIPVNLTLNGTLPETAETFVVEVKANTPGAPLPEGAEGDIYAMEFVGNSAHVSDVLSIDFSAAGLGVYEYTVKQIAGTDPDCFYDSAVYNLTVYILNKEDFSGFEMHVVIYNGEEKPDSFDFVNRYCNPVKVTVSAIKTLNGGEPYSNMFLFQLMDENGKVVDEVRNDKGSVTFHEMVFGEPEDLGKHTFTMSEVDENAHSITYDKSVYSVIIDVTKDENGDYQAKLNYELKGKAYEGTPTFANKQKVPNSPYTGDNLQILMWGGLLIVSAVALTILMFTARRKKNAAKAYELAMDQSDDSDLDE